MSDNPAETKRYHLSMAAAHLLQAIPDAQLPEVLDRLIEIWSRCKPAHEAVVRVDNPERQ